MSSIVKHVRTDDIPKQLYGKFLFKTILCKATHLDEEEM